jgi:hypothetical protein
MLERHNRVVRQLQQRLRNCDVQPAQDIKGVLPELQARVRRLRSLGNEYSAASVSEDVLRLCAPNDTMRVRGARATKEGGGAPLVLQPPG